MWNLWSLAVCAALHAQPVGSPPPPVVPAPATPAAPAPAARPAFLPSQHGFRFVNRFSGSPLPPELRSADSPAGKLLHAALQGSELPTRFGLCGGMSAAAADFYWAGLTRPDATTPPEQGTALYEYIHARQADSLGESYLLALKFWTWMNLPDRADEADSTTSLTAKELPIIRSRLAAHGLVPLGLVYVRGHRNQLAPDSRPGDLWDNHQVLVYAMTTQPEVVELSIYDPNYPNDDHAVVRLEKIPGNEAYTGSLRTSTGRIKPVRGCFAMPYEKHVPPASLAGVGVEKGSGAASPAAPR